MFQPNEDKNGFTYLSDFGQVKVPSAVVAHVNAMTDDERKRWERGLQRHIAHEWCRGASVSEIVI